MSAVDELRESIAERVSNHNEVDGLVESIALTLLLSIQTRVFRRGSADKNYSDSVRTKMQELGYIGPDGNVTQYGCAFAERLFNEGYQGTDFSNI